MGESLPLVWPDEVLFFNPAENLANTGSLTTTVLENFIPGMEKYTYWMPPVYMLLTATLFFFTSATLFKARLLSTLLAMMAVFVMDRTLAKMNFSARARFSVLFLVLTDFLFLQVTHTARMESASILFGALSLYFVFPGSVENRNVILSGVFSGLSFLSHPFGVTYGIVAFLVIQRDNLSFKRFVYFGSGVAAMLLAWGLYIMQSPDLFLIQFGAQFGRKGELLKTFSLIDKIKIILFGFRFNYAKLFSFILLGAALIVQRKHAVKRIHFMIYFGTIAFFILLSSETWYVAHLVIPVALLTVMLAEDGNKIARANFYYAAAFNIFTLIWFISRAFILEDIPSKNREFMKLTAVELQNAETVYIQSIPDPYFYLKENFPEKKLKEFIPGELPLPDQGFSAEISKQDAFLFYNTELAHPAIREYLEKNSSVFTKKMIEVPVKLEKYIRLRTFIYIKNEKINPDSDISPAAVQ